MKKLHEGIVEIEVDGEVVELKPTPDALARIDEHFDGLLPAAAAVERSSPKAIATIVTLGAGARGQQAKELMGKVLRPGYGRYQEPVGRYLIYLLNGGFEPGEEAKKGGGAEGEG